MYLNIKCYRNNKFFSPLIDDILWYLFDDVQPISIVTIMTYKHRYCYSIAFTTGLILLMKVHKYILPQHVMKIFGRLVLCWGMLWRWSQDWRDQQTKKLTRKTISVVGLQLHSLEAEEERRRRDKFMSILGNPSHPLYELWQMGSPFSH